MVHDTPNRWLVLTVTIFARTLTRSALDGRQIESAETLWICSCCRMPPEGAAGDKDTTCGNWTRSGEGSAVVGHHDRMGLRDDDASKSWNSSHGTRGCGLDALRTTGGAGLFYCFAAN